MREGGREGEGGWKRVVEGAEREKQLGKGKGDEKKKEEADIDTHLRESGGGDMDHTCTFHRASDREIESGKHLLT